MSHIPGIDVIDFVLLTVYPVVGLFIIEMIARAVKLVNWAKLSIQAAVSIGFGIAYVTVIAAHWMTALVLFALAAALLYQAKLAKLKPGKSVY